MQAVPLIFSGLGGVSTALATTAALVQGVGSMQEARYQQRVALNNQVIAQQNAARVRNETQVESQAQDERASLEIGNLLANMGASGLQVGVGSLALRRRTAGSLATRDRENLAYQGETQARGYEQQAQDFGVEASNAQRARRNALLSTFLNVGDSLISGATAVNRRKAAKISMGG